MVVNERFPVLSTIAKILWIIGILLCLVGLLAFFTELVEVVRLLSLTGAEWVWSNEDYIKIGVFAVSTFHGLILMAIAECIGVLFAIEKNTRS